MLLWIRKILARLDLKPVTFNPPLLLSGLLAALILIGMVLLKLPVSTVRPISWLDALFLSTSASTVTGLTLFDVPATFSLFGQIVLMVLIQVGGIGVMSFAVFFFVLMGKKISIRQRQLMQEALGSPSIGGVIRLVSWLFTFSFVIELVGAFFLAFRFIPDYGWGRGIYYSIFHSISGFNQAGFSLFPGSMAQYVGDPIVNLTLTMLITLGGIGFTVLADLLSTRRFRKLQLHSQVMLVGTVIINVGAVLAIFLIEAGNPRTLGALSGWDKAWAAFFQGIAPRTAGFSTFDPAGLSQAALLLTMLMMFIGAGSTSTSGGIKLTTFMIVVAEVATFLRGRREVVLNKRTIKHQVIVRAVSIISISVAVVFLALFLLCLSEDLPFMMILFEVISAFGTAGLSIGATSELSVFGQIVIMCVMFFGKVGPLTLAFSVTRRSKVDIRYPDGEIYTG
ncbi:TrkH family potassium uptake protein [Sporolactobacillus sp. THM19-2]|uniref:TrkH family potassium uptake protein n=1 Tax=Sporolactobacillus sp. THM19-2 TaxID=2511171 RepID=UPI00102010BE|nr:TrkH family potassium uptake protein [Sporolactobacillus sp. THM19-2]RYL93963.1 Ktr system potassium transporter B [Sporolactobacillus sp. THM19-2]